MHLSCSAPVFHGGRYGTHGSETRDQRGEESRRPVQHDYKSVELYQAFPMLLWGSCVGLTMPASEAPIDTAMTRECSPAYVHTAYHSKPPPNGIVHAIFSVRLQLKGRTVRKEKAEVFWAVW